MAGNPKVVFVGQPSGTAMSRFRGLCEIEDDVHYFDSVAPFLRYGLLYEIERRSLFGLAYRAANANLLAFCDQVRPEIIWVDKGDWISPSTLSRLRASGAFLVHHNTDRLSPIPWRVRWAYRRLRQTLSQYDIYFTSNLHDYAEVSARGVPKTELTYLGYDRDRFNDTPLPADLASKYARKIQFNGHYEPRTAQGIVALAEAGLPVTVVGYGWSRAPELKRFGNAVLGQIVSDEDFVRYLKGCEIGLGFVSEWNGNETAGRSFEIPASGTFLLAMRTSQHQECYEEGEEAEFFGDPDELVRKARYYLEHPEHRQTIARKGHDRCVVKSDYSWQRFMRDDWAKVLTAYEGRGREPIGRAVPKEVDR